ncbi:hypothetical protein [Larsenimonas rhizosphaerae]|uniref:Uncharacterized protein n=1 Tax=Larsenimonas rhizosphaerae TaxID=2944682 RepID=A0AA41ZHG6_9GAMM|nr:hypothetical protein [Larsenimonas rhizosphaerae]MCM2131933.1 hypothetical protein [Larsenimonas rhizosphaerae]MCX2524761.1 hypothetical protein [Larsenimonas rhizosphaerae]
MNVRHLVAALSLSILPMAAHASAITDHAGRIHSEPLSTRTAPAFESVGYAPIHDIRGTSISMARTQAYLSHGVLDTSLPAMTTDTPDVGHRADW